MNRILAVAVAGALGALARYGVNSFVAQRLHMRMLWGTLAVNVIGCLLFGIVWYLADERQIITPIWRIAILAGFLGGLTTFSGFAHDTGELVRAGAWVPALANIAAQNALGLLAFFAGLRLARMF